MARRHWSQPTKALSFAVSKETADALKSEADRLDTTPSKLARLYIEKALGFDNPKLYNADFKLWDKMHVKEPY